MQNNFKQAFRFDYAEKIDIHHTMLFCADILCSIRARSPIPIM